MRCDFSWDWQIILRTRSPFLSLPYHCWEHQPNTAPALDKANVWFELAELKICPITLGITFCPVCAFWKDATIAITVGTLVLRMISFLNKYILAYLFERVKNSTVWNQCEFFSKRVKKFVWKFLQPSVSTDPVVNSTQVDNDSVLRYNCVLHWKRTIYAQDTTASAKDSWEGKQ